MRLFRLFASRVGIFYCVCAALLIIAAYSQMARNFSVVSPDRYYYGGDEFPLDLTGDLAHIREGFEGHWLAFFNLTTAYPPLPSILKFEYILIGKFARLAFLDPLSGFHVARFLISLCWFTSMYWIIIRTYKKTWQQVAAIIICLFGASIYTSDPHSFVKIAVLDAQGLFRYILAMPHYMLGGCLSILSLFFLSRVIDDSKKRSALVISLLMSMWSSLLYGPTSVIILLSVPLFVLLQMRMFLKEHRSRRSYITLFIITGMYIAATAIPILYVRYIVAYVWKDFNLSAHVEHLNPFSLSVWEYLLAVNIPFILSLFALPEIIRKKQTFLALLYPWVFLHPIAFYWLTGLLDLNKIRFFLVPYYVVFGLLAVSGISTILRLIPLKRQGIQTAITGLCLAAVLIAGVPSLYQNYKGFALCFCIGTNFDYGYPSKHLMEGIFWLRDHTQDSDIVLSDTYAGTLIPSFAGNIVYTSWWFRLSDVPEFYTHALPMVMFFRGQDTEEQAADFLKKQHISYILYGQQERSISPWNGEPTYKSISEVARFDNVVVYKVK